ncbi:MAG: hypothetical protein OXQ90_03825 [Gammaproteobacteria bacterium]|nr:hypothetical protein [Gammaproteobacteria bacterium]
MAARVRAICLLAYVLAVALAVYWLSESIFFAVMASVFWVGGHAWLFDTSDCGTEHSR